MPPKVSLNPLAAVVLLLPVLMMHLTILEHFRLESQCVTAISFVKNEPELLDSPIWVLIINIVALEMLKAKLPQGMFLFSSRAEAHLEAYD